MLPFAQCYSAGAIQNLTTNTTLIWHSLVVKDALEYVNDQERPLMNWQVV